MLPGELLSPGGGFMECRPQSPLQVPALGGESRIVPPSTPAWGKTLWPADFGGFGSCLSAQAHMIPVHMSVLW